MIYLYHDNYSRRREDVTGVEVCPDGLIRARSPASAAK